MTLSLYWTTSMLLLVMLVMAGTALAAFYWAARDGQFDDMRKGALSIFDSEEPQGVPTDAFPARAPKASRTPPPNP